MEVPTLEMVRLRSGLLRSRFVSPEGDAELTALRGDAVGIVSLATGRIIGGVTGTGMFGCPLEEVPANLEPVLLRSIVKKIEQMAVADVEETRSGQVENQEGGLASFSAGQYSESYFQPGSSSSSTGSLVIDSDPATNAGLVLAMTECTRLGWLHQADPVNFPYAPACAVTSYDWFPETSRSRWGYGPDGF